MREIESFTKCKPIDFELAELLGEDPADFIILYLNGEVLDGYGTPPDNPRNRDFMLELVDRHNDRSKDSLWPKTFESWGKEIRRQFRLSSDVTAEDFHPEFSIKIERVVAGYSENLHCAIRLFEQLRDRIKAWSVNQMSDGRCWVEIEPATGIKFMRSGDPMAHVIATAIKNLLLNIRKN